MSLAKGFVALLGAVLLARPPLEMEAAELYVPLAGEWEVLEGSCERCEGCGECEEHCRAGESFAVDLRPVGPESPPHPVIAAAEGVVSEVLNDTGGPGCGAVPGWGNYVLLSHSDGRFTRYGHLDYGTVVVTPGEFVPRGWVLGTLGCSGEAKERQMHFQVEESAGGPSCPSPSRASMGRLSAGNVIDRRARRSIRQGSYGETPTTVAFRSSRTALRST